jgi:high-affinity Fe2+/Pb2+ permease
VSSIFNISLAIVYFIFSDRIILFLANIKLYVPLKHTKELLLKNDLQLILYFAIISILIALVLRLRKPVKIFIKEAQLLKH